MVPIVLAAVVALAIIGNRLWLLRNERIAPPGLADAIEELIRKGEVQGALQRLKDSNTPLARILLAGLRNAGSQREFIKESIEEVGRQEVAVLERYLNVLGTIAGVSPLLGLLGTVFGIMHAFSAINMVGVGNPRVLAGGISEALITTAAGLIVAIPSLMMYRYFRGKIDELILIMEKESLKVVELVQGARR